MCLFIYLLKVDCLISDRKTFPLGSLIPGEFLIRFLKKKTLLGTLIPGDTLIIGKGVIPLIEVD